MNDGVRRVWHLVDERQPEGGRAKAWLFLTHPGPSLLVTAVTVAAAALLARRVPDQRTVLGLVLVMLPAQLAIGTLNDWADAASDAASKPFKPLVRGVVSRRQAAVLAAVLATVSLATAGWLGVTVLAVALLGLGAGAAYDLALKPTPLAVLAWWAGFVALPLLAMAVTGRFRGGPEILPLAGLLAIGLQLANSVPDSQGDRRAGARTLAALLGDRRARQLMAGALLGAALLVVVLRPVLAQTGWALVAAAALAVASLTAAAPSSARRAVFPVAATCVAAATVSWLAALPPPSPG